MLNRTALRQRLRAQRAQVSVAEQINASDSIAQQIISSSVFKRSTHIAIYAAQGGEIDPFSLVKETQAQSKQWYLPIMHAQQPLTFMHYVPDETLTPNAHGILEPSFDTDKVRPTAQLDLILVPLLGFDLNGNRLGMGGGYYDRTFAFLTATATRPAQPYLMGLAYAWQCCTTLEAAPWDVPLNTVVTPEQIYYLR